MTLPLSPVETTSMDVLITLLDTAASIPAYANPGDAGADLTSVVDLTIAPGQRVKVPTGLAIALPDGFAAFVHPRSGLAAKHGVTIVNAPGTIDAGYRGEIQVLLINTDPHEPMHIARGDRIAQLVIQRVEKARFIQAEHLPGSHRGAGGFGSTGVRALDAGPVQADPAQAGPAQADALGADMVAGTVDADLAHALASVPAV